VLLLLLLFLGVEAGASTEVDFLAGISFLFINLKKW
jgi:hypothetical protein